MNPLAISVFSSIYQAPFTSENSVKQSNILLDFDVRGLEETIVMFLLAVCTFILMASIGKQNT